MPILNPLPPVIFWHDMRIDELDGGIPRLSFTDPNSGETATYQLAPDAVAGLVDGLAGVAPPPPGQVRIVVRMEASAFAQSLLASQHLQGAHPRAPASPPFATEAVSMAKLREAMDAARRDLLMRLDPEKAQALADPADWIYQLPRDLGPPAVEAPRAAGPMAGAFRCFEDAVAKMHDTGEMMCRGGARPYIELIRNEDGRPAFRAWFEQDGWPSVYTEPWSPSYSDLVATDWQAVP